MEGWVGEGGASGCVVVSNSGMNMFWGFIWFEGKGGKEEKK